MAQSLVERYAFDLRLGALDVLQLAVALELRNQKLVDTSTKIGRRFDMNVYGKITVDAGKSPGGSDENTGNASKLIERLMIGMVDVTWTDPVKFSNPSSGPTLADPCASGPSIFVALPNDTPAVLKAVIVTVADCVVDGLP